ncbi:hypothetical protein BV22DRAFT_86642 [Leucogyrophana mollusca]|uniref:Uncharacterized protein n=1 Tax=Leucogyrophana mollusca TaxID=85980 RepID=A0ACB8BX64_9AGAM|nr:hypothetical protein BV22DRAFT_86642 [Leucogyrophana mollusca]
MASADIQWMPAPGRHSVAVGSSLGRSLKARKGVAAPKRSNLPDRDLYSFRYNFKPESIDTNKPGSIEVQRSKESTSIRVERPSAQAGESHVFKAVEQPVKEVDCVLIYDEELGTFTLEKLDSFLSLSYDKKVTGATTSLARQSASPLPTPSQGSRSKGDSDLESQLERDLGLADVDADGEPDDEYEDMILSSIPQKEEEEEEEEEINPPPPKVASVAPPLKPKPPQASKVIKKQEAPPPKIKTKAKESSRPKREHESRTGNDSDLEEVLDFGVPARQAKRPKSSSSGGLAFPGASSSFTSLPSAREPAATAPTSRAVAESDSDQDWDFVAGDGTAAASADGDVAGGEVEEEIDLAAFEQEMQLELEESDEDILADAMSPEPEPAVSAPGRPISLNQFAGGELSPDEDDTSSSEDSDDD